LEQALKCAEAREEQHNSLRIAVKAHDTYVTEQNTYVTHLKSEVQAAAVDMESVRLAAEEQTAALSEHIVQLTAEGEMHTRQAGAQGEALREARAQQASLREELSELKSVLSAEASTPAKGSGGLQQEVRKAYVGVCKCVCVSVCVCECVRPHPYEGESGAQTRGEEGTL
jgi:chromosome segregation ATPase